MTMLFMRDVDLCGKRVLIRADFNVPMENGDISNDARIRATLPTIQKALDAGACVMLMSHLGRPKEGVIDPALSLAPIAKRLSVLLEQPVTLLVDWKEGFDCDPGRIFLLENIRFNLGEKSNDDILALQLASLCDVFVMDAFGSAHRAHASTCGVARYAPIACAGPLVEAEIRALSRAVAHAKKPVVAIVGGSKVSSKISVLKHLCDMVDVLIVGGGIANTFLVAQGHTVGQSLYELDFVPEAKAVIALCQERGVALPLPIDVRVGDRFSSEAVASVRSVNAVGEHELILDIGPETMKTYLPFIQQANTIIWNGPVGVFEMPQFSEGTREMAQAIANSHAFTLAGGGDTVAAIDLFGIQDKISYISTGGGAFLEFLEGKILPSLQVLEERYDALPHTL
jgi:phosphoglycerate kinase